MASTNGWAAGHSMTDTRSRSATTTSSLHGTPPCESQVAALAELADGLEVVGRAELARDYGHVPDGQLRDESRDPADRLERAVVRLGAHLLQ